MNLGVVLTVARRELGGLFYSPIAYVASAVFLLAAGFAFSDDFVPGQPAVMRSLFEWMVWVAVFVAPVLCMGLLAQEYAAGTLETLMTAPVRETEVVAGKFAGALAFFLAMLAPTVLYWLMLRLYGRPDAGPIWAGYLGLALVGALFVAIGLLCSSLARSPVVAAVLAAAVLFLITIVPWWASSKATLSPWGTRLVEQGVLSRYSDFAKGLLDLGNVAYFIVATAVILFATVKSLESRRWR